MGWAIAPTSASVLGDLDSHIDRVASEIAEQIPTARAGTAIGGSYDPATGTVEMLFGDTYAILGDDGSPGDAFINHQKLPLLTLCPGLQYGPTGVERIEAVPLSTGFGVLFRQYTDDSPQAPPGEIYLLHKTKATQTQPAALYDGGVKFTNDGPTNGDGLGGTYLGHQGALTRAKTASGHQISLNDTSKQIGIATAGVGNPNPLTATFDDPSQTIKHAIGAAIFSVLDAVNKQITHQAGGQVSTTLTDTASVQKIVDSAAANVQTVVDGLLQKITHQAAPNTLSTVDGLAQAITHQGSPSAYTIVDGAGVAISHVVPTGTLALGDTVANLAAAGKGAINNDILTQFGGNINIFGLSNLRQYATLLNTAGVITSGQLATMLGALITSWVTKVVVPSGSSIVKIAA